MKDRYRRAIGGDNRGVTNTPSKNCRLRENHMPAVITIGFMLSIWVVVLWGSSHFNNNIH
jgi:hypothetical protein